MRPLIPAALLLAYACGSSNPEPVSAPTPADSAALARATPHAFIAAREQYYDIDGSSAGALRNQINRLGPKDESGESKDATVWSVESAYAAARRQLRPARCEGHAGRHRHTAPLEATGHGYRPAREDVANLPQGRSGP